MDETPVAYPAAAVPTFTRPTGYPCHGYDQWDSPSTLYSKGPGIAHSDAAPDRPPCPPRHLRQTSESAEVADGAVPE